MLTNLILFLSFIVQPALFCVENPVLSYLLTMTPQEAGNAIEVSLGANETYLVLGPFTGLVVGHKYDYTVTAFNVIGNTTSTMGRKLLSKQPINIKYDMVNSHCLIMQ